jgi:hypothetical protein
MGVDGKRELVVVLELGWWIFSQGCLGCWPLDGEISGADFSVNLWKWVSGCGYASGSK